MGLLAVYRQSLRMIKRTISLKKYRVDSKSSHLSMDGSNKRDYLLRIKSLLINLEIK